MRCTAPILIPLDNSPTDEAILKHIRRWRLTGGALCRHVADGFAARKSGGAELAEFAGIMRIAHISRAGEGTGDDGFVSSHWEQGDPTAGSWPSPALVRDPDATLGHRFAGGSCAEAAEQFGIGRYSDFDAAGAGRRRRPRAMSQ